MTSTSAVTPRVYIISSRIFLGIRPRTRFVLGKLLLLILFVPIQSFAKIIYSRTYERVRLKNFDSSLYDMSRGVRWSLNRLAAKKSFSMRFSTPLTDPASTPFFLLFSEGTVKGHFANFYPRWRVHTRVYISYLPSIVYAKISSFFIPRITSYYIDFTQRKIYSNFAYKYTTCSFVESKIDTWPLAYRTARAYAKLRGNTTYTVSRI